jgi:hypothetical protein
MVESQHAFTVLLTFHSWGEKCFHYEDTAQHTVMHTHARTDTHTNESYLYVFTALSRLQTLTFGPQAIHSYMGLAGYISPGAWDQTYGLTGENVP